MSVDLDELDRLRAAATQGEWEVSTDDDGDIVIWCNGEWLMNIGDWSLQDGPPEQVKFVQDCDRATADYIVALVRAYPALAAELRELRASAREIVPVPVREIVHSLEGEAGNTDTDPRWVAASELRRMNAWETRTLLCRLDEPEPITRTRGPKP